MRSAGGHGGGLDELPHAGNARRNDSHLSHLLIHACPTAPFFGRWERGDSSRVPRRRPLLFRGAAQQE
ncbi:predicted protein [Streptomyces sp. SPB78]|nr:predicted protein [Streptomyces sp. SPB78]